MTLWDVRSLIPMTKHSSAAFTQLRKKKQSTGAIGNIQSSWNSSCHMLSHHCTCPVQPHTSCWFYRSWSFASALCSFYYMRWQQGEKLSKIQLLKNLLAPELDQGVGGRTDVWEWGSGFYTIWQSVSQHGALSCVKYLAALPSNSQSGCLESLVDFRPLLACFLVSERFLLINKPSTVRVSATFTGIN